MHDRLIAADALIRGVPLVTRDAALTASPQIETSGSDGSAAGLPRR